MGKDKVGLLFLMTIDPKIASIPFADIQEVSYYAREAEILFSMHTVFRIGTINRKDGGRSYFEVSLSLTENDDMQLRNLMEQLDSETRFSNIWVRMGALLIKVGQPDKAEELYHTLLEQTWNAIDQVACYHQLGFIKHDQGDYREALSFYERALEICEKNLPNNHPSLATSYNNIGSVYSNMGEYSKAISSLERSPKIYQTNIPANHSDLATSNNNVGAVYDDMGEYRRALSFYERALEIRQKSLNVNHPGLATSYNNIGLVYFNMGEYSKALFFNEKSLEICENSLSANHPVLATCYNNIGSLYYNMGDYSKALPLLDRAVKIWQESLPVNHPHLKILLQNMELLKSKSNTI